MKLVLVLLFGAMIGQSHAFKMTDEYVIFEKGDREADQFIQLIIQTYVSMGLNPLERNDFTEEMYEELDQINSTLHKAYLKRFNKSEEEFPLPYVVFDRSFVSANFGVPVGGNKVLASNFITISFSHIKSKKALWATLAHEIAHYYHKHQLDGRTYIKASYTDNRELDEHNHFGENIDHDPFLISKLEMVSRLANIYEGQGANVEKLKTIKIGSSDPILSLIVRLFKDVFNYQSTDNLADLSCYGIKNKITLLAMGQEKLGAKIINDINTMAKVCPVTKNIGHMQFLPNILPMNRAYDVVQSPRKYIKDGDPNLKIISNDVLNNVHTLATALKIIHNYRVELKALVESIQWDKLQFYTKENEADITSFKVLSDLGLGHYQVAFLDLVLKKNECIESLTNEAIEIEYYSHTELDTHNSMCWRVYRSKQMLENMKKMTSTIE